MKGALRARFGDVAQPLPGRVGRAAPLAGFGLLPGGAPSATSAAPAAGRGTAPGGGSVAAGRRKADPRRSEDTPAWRERGVASLEYLGMLPFLLLVALAGIQLGIAAYCGEQAGTAARTAARTEALHSPHPDAVQAGQDAVSDWVHPDIRFTVDTDVTVTATAKVHVPSVFPGVRLFDPITRSATMPKEDATP